MFAETLTFVFSDEPESQITEFHAWISEHGVEPGTLARLVTQGSDAVPTSRQTHYCGFMGLTSKGFKMLTKGTEIDSGLSYIKEFQAIPLSAIVHMFDIITSHTENA